MLMELMKMEVPKSRKSNNLLCPFERMPPRMEDVALQQLKAKKCVVWLRDKLTTDNAKHSTRPKAYRVDSSRGQRSNPTGSSHHRNNLKTNKDLMDSKHLQKDKTVSAKLMESLIVDGCGVKFYHKKSTPISYTRIWTTPVNPKGKVGSTPHKGQPITSSLFAVTCFLKLRQSSAAQNINQRVARNQTLTKNPQRGLTTNWKLSNCKSTTEKERTNEKKESSKKTGTELEQGTKDELDTPEKIHRRRSRRSLIWWFKVIKAVCRLALDMKILSMSRTDNDASSEAYYQYVVGPNTDVNLFFDKRLFSRKIGSQVPLWAQAIAIKKPHTRTDKELHMLNELMMTVRSYREKFESSMKELVCRVFRYTNCERGRIVLRQSHIGLGFFLVYSGSLYVQKETSGKSGRKQTDLENIIRSGQHFGEVALLGDGLRTATVICREPSELFYIERDDFISICPNIFDNELAEKIRFAQKFSFFHGWEETALQKLCLLSQVLYISHGQILEEDWLKTQYLYFLMQGRISLLKKFQASPATRLANNSAQTQVTIKSANRNSQQPFVAVVGHLHAGDHSELAVLNNEETSSGVSMLSDGVRVLRISKKNTLSLGSTSYIQKFFQKYTPRQIPSGDELCKNYHDSSKWNKFKKQVLYTQLLEKNGAALAFIPAASKGSATRDRNTPSPFDKYPEFVGLKP